MNNRRQSGIHIREARPRDLDAIARLENESFESDRVSRRSLREFLRAPHRPGPALDEAHRALRARVPHLTTDRPVYRDVATVRSLLDDGAIIAAVRRHLALE